MLFNILNKLYRRFIAPSPLAFKIVNWVSNICFVIGAIQELFGYFPIELPAPYNAITAKVFMIAAGIIRLISGMTIEKPKQDEKR